MNIEELYETGERKQDRCHFRNMVLIAKSDGETSEKEIELLFKIGKEIGLGTLQIQDMIDHASDYNPSSPSNRDERFEQIINLIEMIQADGKIEDTEMNILSRIAVGIGYRDIDEVDVESIVSLIVRGEDTEAIIHDLL